MDAAGYFYDPMSTNNIFGNPAPFVTKEQAKSGMPKAHDDSMMPQFSQPRFQRDIHQGSSGPNYNDFRSKMDFIQTRSALQLAAFAVVVGVALWL